MEAMLSPQQQRRIVVALAVLLGVALVVSLLGPLLPG